MTSTTIPREHDGSSYLCPCPLCEAERVHRVANLSRRAKRTAQPWDTGKVVHAPVPSD